LWKGGRSPVELAFAAGEKVAKFGKEAPEKIKNAVTEATKKAYDKAEAVAVQTAESLKQDLCIGAATVLELQAEVAEKTANLMEKLETRNAIKISKLEEVDKSVFESMQAIKKEMHSLTEITPFQKADYVPDPQITNEIQKLKQLAPDSTINFAIKLYEDTLKKQETLYHKTQAKAEKKVNKQVETKKDSLTADYFKLYGKQTENLAKIEKSLNRLDKIASAREAVLDFSKDLTNSAKELTQNTGKKAEVEAEAERE
jgi:chorismate mutase